MSDALAYAHLLKRVPAQGRSLARVEALLDAGAELLRDREPREVTVRDLAAAAGVPTGTLYQFFADKDAVLQALAVRFVAAMPSVLDEVLTDRGEDWAETVGHIVDGYAAIVREHPAIRQLWLSGSLDAATRRLERETDATIAARVGATLSRQAGSRGGTQAQWEVFAALVNGLLIHAFTDDPQGDEDVLAETRQAARAYAAVVLGRCSAPSPGTADTCADFSTSTRR